MCGIAGIVATGLAAPEMAELQRMCDAMVHRGPDDAGYLVDGPVALGMRRLSIIDLDTGKQPIFNETRDVAVVFNGEIYNYRELRSDLRAKGHTFRTASDTEVIVHLWEEVGIDFPRFLNGMFAIALYDRRQHRLVLARDHVGVKPLYYSASKDGLVFASEIKAMLASGRLQPTLDVDNLAQFLAWEYVPGAGTLMREVRRLEPAHTLEFQISTGDIRVREFWDPLETTEVEDARTDQEWEEEVDASIRSGTRRQLVSDVPLGAFLSGGVDSSLVAAAMDQPETFSIGFADPSYDESRWSRRVAEHLGTRHRLERIEPDALGLFDHLMQYMDDPIGDFSIFPTYLVARLASQHVKVALSGDGGDELFGGYDTYLAEEMARLWRRVPRWMRGQVIAPLLHRVPPTDSKKGFVNKAKRFVEGAEHDPSWGHARWRVFCDQAMRSALFTPAVMKACEKPAEAHILALRERAQHRDRRDCALYVDFRSYLVDNCLAKVDRMSMACSLEARVPLLDREVVELAFRLPPRLKYDQRQTKILLKRVAARHVPRECVYRPKEGFSIPMKSWLKDEYRELVEHYLDPARISSGGLFQAATVERLWREHLTNRANHSHLLWSLLVFEQWRERWKVRA